MDTSDLTNPPSIPDPTEKNKSMSRSNFLKVLLISSVIVIGTSTGLFFGIRENIKNADKNIISKNIPIPQSKSVNQLNPVKPSEAFSAAGFGSCRIFPDDNPWNTDISKFPLNPNSSSYINSIGLSKSLHPDFGGFSSGNSWGIPFVLVNNSIKNYPVNFTLYGNESDPGPYPIPLDAPIEGGLNSSGDRHVLAVNTDTCTLYELYRAFPTEKGWNADSGAVFDLKSNKLRPEGWTSADGAGLPIFPGLVKYSEIESGQINHAIRFTTRNTQRAYIHPATHFASSSTNSNLPPMGLRLRLKADIDISKLPRQAKIIATALQKYGLILADNGGDWFFQGEVNNNWDDDDINQLKSITGKDFEAVDTGPLIIK